MFTSGLFIHEKNIIYFHNDPFGCVNPSDWGWLPEAGALCTLKSWWEKESHFLPVKNKVSSKLISNCQKQAKQMQQRNLVFLHLPCVVYSKKEMAARDEDLNWYAQGKYLWFKLPSASGPIMCRHGMPPWTGATAALYFETVNKFQ